MDFLPPNSLTLTVNGGEKNVTPTKLNLYIDEKKFYGEKDNVFQLF